MAELYAKPLVPLVELPFGYVLSVVEVLVANADAADEWFTVQGISKAIAVLGAVVIGTAVGASPVAFRLNLAGTGGADSAGAFAIEAEALLYHVTVLGKR